MPRSFAVASSLSRRAKVPGPELKEAIALSIPAMAAPQWLAVLVDHLADARVEPDEKILETQ